MVFGWFKKNEKKTLQAPASALARPYPEVGPRLELPDALYDKIKRLCAKGDQHAKSKQFDTALTLYWQAHDLLPESKTDWAAGTWILTAIGDANFLSDDFEAGRDNLSVAMHYPNAIGNPFIHLRLGQCQFELGNLDRAADELARAYMGAGLDIFCEDDAKYLNFLETRIKLPAK
jgi:tetratricopeptide (TPR) repeat protein